MPDPVYTADNCKPAYQLRWSLALFPRAELPSADAWLTALKHGTETDGVRVLECHRRAADVWQFLLSTLPAVAPTQIIKSVKGRLQYLVRHTHPQTFRRNFSLTSLGDANRPAVEQYVSDQLGHHRMADPRIEHRLARYQLEFPEVDLARPVFSEHGRYVVNLHVVLVHAERWRDVKEESLDATRDMVLKAARQKGHRLSRLAILADHVHLALGVTYERAPEEIVLSYLNNLAYTHGMQPVYQFGYYVGTFGEYDMAAVRRAADTSG